MVSFAAVIPPDWLAVIEHGDEERAGQEDCHGREEGAGDSAGSRRRHRADAEHPLLRGGDGEFSGAGRTAGFEHQCALAGRGQYRPMIQ